MYWLDIALRLAVALICGAAIGIERQYHQHSAGLRTNILVSTGSALFVLVAVLPGGSSNSIQIASQVVSGVGFLCAGVIIRDGLNVRGLTTAGTLWCASGVGVLAGSGNYIVAALGAAIVLLANLLLRPMSHFLDRHAKTTGKADDIPARYILRAVCLAQQENYIRSLLLHSVNNSNLTLQALQSADTPDATKVEVCANLQTDQRRDTQLEQVVARLSLEERISAVSWEFVSSDSDVSNEPALVPVLVSGPHSAELHAAD
jgi:putative Mg2+ transporter-C (MgtC) family protein